MYVKFEVPREKKICFSSLSQILWSQHECNFQPKIFIAIIKRVKYNVIVKDSFLIINYSSINYSINFVYLTLVHKNHGQYHGLLKGTLSSATEDLFTHSKTFFHFVYFDLKKNIKFLIKFLLIWSKIQQIDFYIQ